MASTLPQREMRAREEPGRLCRRAGCRQLLSRGTQGTEIVPCAGAARCIEWGGQRIAEERCCLCRARDRGSSA